MTNEDFADSCTQSRHVWASWFPANATREVVPQEPRDGTLCRCGAMKWVRAAQATERLLPE